MRTDEELLAAWRAGDRKAGGELFHRHFEAVRRFFVNKVGREMEDLVQRVFVGCVESRERFEGRSTFRTFLFAVAHNVLREHFRQRRRDAVVDLDEQSVMDLGAGPSSVLADRREQRLLLEGLRRIPIAFQVALELYYWERLTGAELGEILGVPENTARSRVRRAKELLLAAIRRIERSRDVLQSTANDLDAWAASIRAHLSAKASGVQEDVPEEDALEDDTPEDDTPEDDALEDDRPEDAVQDEDDDDDGNGTRDDRAASGGHAVAGRRKPPGRARPGDDPEARK